MMSDASVQSHQKDIIFWCRPDRNAHDQYSHISQGTALMRERRKRASCRKKKLPPRGQDDDARLLGEEIAIVHLTADKARKRDVMKFFIFMSSILYLCIGSLLLVRAPGVDAFSLTPTSEPIHVVSQQKRAPAMSRCLLQPSTSRSFSQRISVRLNMALVPLPTEELEQLLAVGPPTGEQYATYWGRTPQERYGRILESSIVSFLGVFFSYFLSFVLGGLVATILGTLFFFWGILSPQLKAAQRNWEFLGGRQLVDPWKVRGGDPDSAGLYGALYLGFVDDVCVVEKSTDKREYDTVDFADYTMDTDELEQYTGDPYLLRIRLCDSKGRELQVHTRMSEEYLDVRANMPVVAILLSTRRKFDELAAITDLFVPDAECWIGDYPYLSRVEIQSLLAEDDKIWAILEQEADFATAEAEAWEPSPFEEEDDPDDANTDGDENSLDREKVRVQRRGPL